ncbi:MAG: sensor histidine kinase, partial [Mesoflavibacter sp.]|nr:sensor histidine kinase [Mesoflavibacter sp.]
YRVDKSGSRKEGGSGLGLSIVKHIIEAHDEKIYVESEENVGSEFSFTLEKA